MKHIYNYLTFNPRFIKDFKKHLRKANIKRTGMYNGSYITKYSCYESFLEQRRTIIFFEWSDVDNGNKRYFNTIKSFYDFLEESKIAYPDYAAREAMIKFDLIYFACKEGTAILEYGCSREELKEKLEKPKTATTTTYGNGYGFPNNPYPRDYDDYYNDYYD